MKKKTSMNVQILPLGYIGCIVETGDIFLTVRLASGTLVLCPAQIVRPAEPEAVYLQRDGYLAAENR